MHVECSACSARYVIADEKIPMQGARVRCRKCHTVFSIERSAASPAAQSPNALPLIPPTPQTSPPPAPMPPAAMPAAPSPFERAPVPTPYVQPAPGSDQIGATEVERFATAYSSAAPATASLAVPAGPAAPQPAAPAKPVGSSPFSMSAGIPEGLPEPERLKHERARRLARVLASDIAIYNKEKRDRGIQEGNLVAVLGYEIKKSWEVYKERVTSEMANSTPYFRDALNEMLAEGKKIF